MDQIILSRLLTRYPTGSLISELLQIHQGKFVVRVEVQVDGVTRATGLAAAENLELAEDRARSRALMVLLPEPSNVAELGLNALHPAGASEAQPVVKPSLLSPGSDKKQLNSFASSSEWSSSINLPFTAVPLADEPKLTPDGLPKLAVGSSDIPSVAITSFAHADVTDEANAHMHNPQSENDEEVMIPFGEEEPADSYEYSYEENILEPEAAPQVVAEVKKPVNMSEAFAQTTTELKRLDWNTQQGRNYLKQRYSKTSRQQLTDNELLEFLAYLESQPTPNKLPLV